MGECRRRVGDGQAGGGQDVRGLDADGEQVAAGEGHELGGEVVGERRVPQAVAQDAKQPGERARAEVGGEHARGGGLGLCRSGGQHHGSRDERAAPVGPFGHRERCEGETAQRNVDVALHHRSGRRFVSAGTDVRGAREPVRDDGEGRVPAGERIGGGGPGGVGRPGGERCDERLGDANGAVPSARDRRRDLVREGRRRGSRVQRLGPLPEVESVAAGKREPSSTASDLGEREGVRDAGEAVECAGVGVASEFEPGTDVGEESGRAEGSELVSDAVEELGGCVGAVVGGHLHQPPPDRVRQRLGRPAWRVGVVVVRLTTMVADGGDGANGAGR